MRKIVALFFIALLPGILLTGCSKPNPTPEVLDPIYGDLSKREADFAAQIAAEEKLLAEHKEKLLKLTPQTGQIKFAQKRYFESLARIAKLEQMKKYYSLRKETRKSYVRTEYLKAFRENRPWPDPKEYQDYKAQKALEDAPRVWNAKERFERAKLPTKKRAGASSEKGEKAAEGGH